MIDGIIIKSAYRIVATAAVLTMVSGQAAFGQILKEDDPALRNIDIEERLGDTIPHDVALVTDRGDTTTVGAYLGDDKPVILIMAYYTCPMLCNLILNGTAEAVANLSLKPGEEYRIITVSIDPTETFELAAAKKKNYIENMGISGIDEAWIFCTASADESRKLADAIGFRYYYDEELKQYAHAAVLTILSPDGVISRYIYGIEYNPRDLRLALLEASEGEIGSTIDRILLYCYRYDPDAGGYTLFALNIMKLGGAATIIVLALFLGVLWIRELRRRSRSDMQPQEHRTR